MAETATPLGINVVNDKMDEMISVAKQLSVPGKGFLASDEKEAGMGSKFDLINIENTKANRLKYRTMLYTTPGANKYLSGIIFNHETFTEGKIEKTGQRLVDYVIAEGILVGIKVDIGPRPLPYKPNEQYTAGIDGLGRRAAFYYKDGARFTKLRVIFRIQNGYISPTAMTENMYLSAKYALICQANGLVPIVEPDLVMAGDHSAEVCKYWTSKILNRMYAVLNEYDVDLRATILKPNMILSGKANNKKRSFRENALNTIDVLSANVPVSVPGTTYFPSIRSHKLAEFRYFVFERRHVRRGGNIEPECNQSALCEAIRSRDNFQSSMVH